MSIFLLPLAFLSYALLRVFKYYYTQRHLRNIPGPPPDSFLAGNIKQLYAPNSLEFHEEISQKYGPVVRVNGMFGDSQLYVFDSAAMYSMYVKDQYIYDVTDSFIETNLLIVGEGVFATRGVQHRRQRKLLNPVFHIAHMRHILPIFYEITHSLRDKIASKIPAGGAEIDMLKWLANASLELIGQGGLGYSFEKEAEEDKALKYGKAIHAILPSTGTSKMVLLIRFTPWVVKLGSASLRRWLIKFSPWRDIKKTRDIIDTMYTASDSILQVKKVALARGDDAVVDQIGRGKDIMSLLMKANMEASEEDRLPESEILAQMTSFLLAGMDTTSGALARILHQLALHPEAQETLRRELTEARDERGDLSYDDLHTLPYLEAVVRETLRLFPPLFVSARTTRKDIMMPLSSPITGKDGKQMHEIFVPKNTNVMAGLVAANRNAALWGEDAREWKPERWLSKLPQPLIDARIPGVYSNLMTFVGGSRACIGFKFAQMGIKVTLSILLPSFDFSLPEKRELVWETQRLQAPTVKHEGSAPQLPLKVTPIA